MTTIIIKIGVKMFYKINKKIIQFYSFIFSILLAGCADEKSLSCACSGIVTAVCGGAGFPGACWN